jgi:hypothetical protein
MEDALIRDFEEELTTTAQAAVQHVVGRAKVEIMRVLKTARAERDAGLREVEQKQRELAMEVAAMQKMRLAQNSRVELEVGGSTFVTSVATLRSCEGSMLAALFSGRYAVDVCEEGGGFRAFLDRDGEAFEYILAYLRDGVLPLGVEEDVVMLRRLKREFGYYCMELYEEHELALVVGGVDENEDAVATVDKYDVSRGGWKGMSSMGTARHSAGVCVVDDNAYVVGGMIGSDKLSTVERYCVSTDTWSPVKDMPYARGFHCVCAVARCLYVTGGFNNQREQLQSMLKYDVDADSWSEVAPMPVPRARHTACVLGDDIYVAGGGDANNHQATLYKYDTATDEWSICAPMSQARLLHSACVLDGMMYVAGGNLGMRTMVQYDPVLDTWNNMAPMPRGRDELGLFTLGGLIYAVSTQVMDVYTPATNSWSTRQNMSVPREAIAVCSVKLEVNVFDAMIVRARRG